MKIDVIDTPRAMLDILARPLGDRRAALRELIAPMYEHVPMPGDPVDLHHQGGGFRVDADDARYLPHWSAWSPRTSPADQARTPARIGRAARSGSSLTR
jgi:hypothetical protein